MSRVTCAHHLAQSDQKPKYQEQQGRQQRSLRCALPAGQASAGQCFLTLLAEKNIFACQ